MTINKEELYKLYMEWVNDVAETCDWKTHFGPEEIVDAIAGIIEEHPELSSNTTFETVTEELLPKTTLRYYAGGKELKVGDRVIFGITDTSSLKENGFSMTLDMFVLDGKLIYQLYSTAG